MKRTVFVQELVKCGDPFSVEMPNSALTGHPYLQHASPLAVMNETGSGQIVRVRSANLRPNTGPNTLTSLVSLRRISAVTPGVPTVPFKFDSANADLPSQVLIGSSPAAFTGPATSAYRRTMALSEQNPTRALATLCAAANGDARSGMDSGEFIRLTGDAALTGYILREGEGLALVFDTDSPSHCFTANLRFKNVANGQCYRANEIIEPRYMAGMAAAYIFNGVGSGVVLEVEKIQVREIGTDELVMADYQLIESVGGGEPPTNIVMSDSSQSLPPGITIVKNCVTSRIGSKWGAVLTNPAERRVMLAEPPYGVGISAGPQVARRGELARDFAVSESEIILREGQGFALFLRSAGAQLCHEAVFVLTVEDAYPTAAEIAEAVWSRAGRSLTG